jgi:uncharacterized membrane protein
MSMDENTPKIPRRRLWLRILFGLSLALNLLVLGLAVGTVLRFGGPDEARRPPPVLGATLYRELPRDHRRAFRQAMEDMSAARAPGRREMAQQFASALRANPFDVSVLQALLDDHAARRGEWHGAANRALLARLEQMSDVERAAYAERVEEALSRSGHKDRRHKDRRD